MFVSLHFSNLKLSVAFQNNLTDLEELIGKWRSICQEAVQDLYEKFNTDNNTLTMGQFLDGLRVTHDLIRYSEEDETFY